MTDKLKPCPFCGNDDVHVKYYEDSTVSVECNLCETIGPLCYEEGTAIKAWNRRVSE